MLIHFPPPLPHSKESQHPLRLSTSHQTGTKKLDQVIQTATTWSKQVLLFKVEPTVDVKVDVSPVWNIIEYSPMAILLGPIPYSVRIMAWL